MKKKIPSVIAVLLMIVLAVGLYYIHMLAPIITGYAAKNLASDVFVGNRSQQSVEALDLNFSFIKFTRNTVDPVKREVVSRFLWVKSKAVYLDGFGCVLVRDCDEEAIRHRPYMVVPPQPCDPDKVPWPMGDKMSDTIPAGIDLKRLSEVVDNALHDSQGNKGTFAVAIAYKNQLIAEKYRPGFSSKNRFLSWSMAKSVTHALVGIMVKRGLMKVGEPTGIAEWENDSRKDIALAHLMHMNSGLKWNEDYGNVSDVNVMLHKAGDMSAFAIHKPLVAKPDSLWLYSSGSTNIVCDLIRKRIGNDRRYYAFPRKELFNPIGMRSAVFEVDASGTFVGSSYLYASIRDYVRFGLLYLKHGNWQGKQILPEDWTNNAVRPARGSGGKYGSFFWLNRSGDYPGVPVDMFYSKGHDGQFVYILPSLQLVVVRTGFSKNGDFDSQKFLAAVVGTVAPGSH